jgi:hypothetical protein
MDQRGAGRSRLTINPFLANFKFNDNLREEFYRIKTWDIISENQILPQHRYIENTLVLPILQI